MSAGVELKNVTRKGPEYEPRYLRGSQHPTTDVQGRGGSSNNSGSECRPATNEYEFIKETGQIRISQQQQTENPLYGDHGTLPVAHPTLTAEKKERNSALSSTRLVQSESPPLSSGSNGITCGGDCVLFVVLSLALIVAVGALVLVLLLFTGTYIPPGSATAPPCTPAKWLRN